MTTFSQSVRLLQHTQDSVFALRSLIFGSQQCELILYGLYHDGAIALNVATRSTTFSHQQISSLTHFFANSRPAISSKVTT